MSENNRRSIYNGGILFNRTEDGYEWNKAHKPDPTEGGTDGTSEWLPVREADGPLVASVYSSPLPVSPNRFYNELGGCWYCGHKVDTYAEDGGCPRCGRTRK